MAKAQIFNEMVRVQIEDNDDITYYNHICGFCINKKFHQFTCNTSRGLICESKSIHYCTACKKPTCYFHSSLVININYCLNCIEEMTRYQEKKFE